MSPKRRMLLRVAMASAILILLLAGAYWEARGKYERDFKGMTEEKVVSLLGKPDVDERRFYPDRREEYSLGWYFFGGAQLGLQFQDGTVCNQTYGSK